mgnify:FL=1
MKSADKKEKRQENQTDFENTEGETEQKCLASPSFLRYIKVMAIMMKFHHYYLQNINLVI